MATLSELETSVAGETGFNLTLDADKALVDRRLNQAVRKVLLDTRCYVTTATMDETSGTGDYMLDTDILLVVALQWSTSTATYSMPERVSPEEILRLRASASSVSSAYPAAVYAVAGSNLLMVWPTPSSADTVTAVYVPRPTEMTADAHDPSNVTYGGIPAEYHDAIEFHAMWRLGSYADDQSSAQGERYRQLYDNEVKEIRKAVRAHGGRPGRAVLHPSRRRLPSRNDVYPG